LSADEGKGAAAISPAELQEIVRVFADSDLRELRLTVGAVDLLVSRNEQVDIHPSGAVTAPAGPARAAAAPAAPTPGIQATDSPPEPAPADAVTGDDPPSADRAGLVPVCAPALGTFYRRPAPDQPPFVDVGTQVAVGDAVGTIEVMKMFTTVSAQVAGTVAEICVGDGVLVEHGQALFYLDPATR
jgi:acetyl-CoA carboxylase biotin carboxyl carrier protein